MFLPLPTIRETRDHCLLRKSGLFRLFTLESRNSKESPELRCFGGKKGIDLFVPLFYLIPPETRSTWPFRNVETNVQRPKGSHPLRWRSGFQPSKVYNLRKLDLKVSCFARYNSPNSRGLKVSHVPSEPSERPFGTGPWRKSSISFHINTRLPVVTRPGESNTLELIRGMKPERIFGHREK